MPEPFDTSAIRAQFPGLRRVVGGQPAIFFDGPAGSQVPQRVADAVRDWLLHDNANHGGDFATSQATDAMVEQARIAAAEFLGGAAHEVVFGANMTTLTFHLARALARTWQPGGEVVVTDSDHDANIAPWVEAANAAGCDLVRLPVRADTTLDLEAARTLIGPRTRFLACGAASNLSGTVHPVRQLADLAHAHGAQVFVDAVHYAPHLRLSVQALGCDFLACSAYKFFGPHLGILWGRGELLAALPASKVRPAADTGPERWQTGTANFEAIAGTLAAIDYLAEIGRRHGGAARTRRPRALDAAFTVIATHEQALAARLLAGLQALPVRLVGLADPARLADRCPTFSFVPPAPHTPAAVARHLGEHGVFAWAGNSYALALTTALGLEPHGVVRLGLLHYHTAAEIDRCLTVLGELLA